MPAVNGFNESEQMEHTNRLCVPIISSASSSCSHSLNSESDDVIIIYEAITKNYNSPLTVTQNQNSDDDITIVYEEINLEVPEFSSTAARGSEDIITESENLDQGISHSDFDNFDPEHLVSLRCVICLDPLPVFESVTRLPCDHWFCSECIVKELMIRGRCPICIRKTSIEQLKKYECLSSECL